MIPDSEKALLKAFKLKNPKLKIHRKRKWDKRKRLLLEKPSPPRYFVKNGHITKLRITGWKELISLPESIGNLVNLQELDLEENALSSLPESIGDLVNLQELDLGGNKLTSLPEKIGDLVNLKKFYLWNNELTSLPESIGDLENLQTIVLGKNFLTSLPESIGDLVNLKEFTLKKNNLTFLPESLGNLINLQYIDISNNNISFLPESFGELVNLQIFLLVNNKFASLPEIFRNLVNLGKLDLSNNPLVSLSNIPLEVLKRSLITTDNLSSIGQSLFTSYSYNEIFQYYQKSPTTLAQQYITSPKSLTSDEKERLSYEARHLEKKILELKVLPDDPILTQITERLVVELPGGFKLHL